MKLYRENIEVADLTIDRNSTITRRMMVEDSLRLNVSVAEPLDLRIQDYVVVEGERYELFDAPQLTIDGSTYGYDALFMGNMHRMERWLLEDGAGDDFTYFGTLDEHMSLILAAVCSKESGWSYTLNVDGVEAMPKSIAYGSVNCLSALHKVAQDYDFEFDVSQKQIVVAHRIERVSQFEFAVGRGEGLYKITRGKVSDAKITTRMYGLGAKTNMENEQRLALDEKYIERNVDKYGLREDKVVFEAIFPRHQGSLTSSAVQLEAGRVQWRVVDSKMDFDLKKQFMDEPKIVFTTGSCAGLEFVITDYDHATRSITFKEYADESQNPVYVVPNDNRKPLIGDEYHYINIIMPEVYVTNAKAELREAVEQELARVSVPTAPYTVDVDPRFIKAQGVRPANGDLVRITNDEVGLDALIRIIAVTYPVIDPNDVELTVCDNILISGSASMMREIRKEISGAMPNKHFHPLTGSKHLPLKASRLTVAEVRVLERIFSDDFNPGLNGFAFTRDEWGRWLLEVDRIVARESLTVPEFIKNRITVANNQTWFTDNGIVETVAEVSGNAGQRIITIAEDKGGACTFQLDDLLKGIYLDEIDGGLSFQTVRMTVLEVITPYALRVSVDESTPPPREELIIVRTGNRTNVDRQNSIFIDGARPAMFYYVNVDSHTIGVDNIAQATGNLKGFNFGDLTGNEPIKERFSNVIRGSNYQEGFFVQKSGSGLGYPVPADRGAWLDIPLAGGVRKCYHYDRVSHNGSIWDCAVTETTAEPSEIASDWTKRVAKGADGAQGPQGDGIGNLVIKANNLVNNSKLIIGNTNQWGYYYFNKSVYAPGTLKAGKTYICGATTTSSEGYLTLMPNEQHAFLGKPFTPSVDVTNIVGFSGVGLPFILEDFRIYEGQIDIGWQPSLADVKSDYTLVADNLATTKSALAEAAANAKTDAAKKALEGQISELDKAKANLDSVYTKALVDGKITQSEQSVIDLANRYTLAQRVLAESTSAAYADGVVTAEEQRAIADATAKAEAARVAAINAAKDMVDYIQIGGGNLLANSRFDDPAFFGVIEGVASLVNDPKFGRVVQWQRTIGSVNFQTNHSINTKILVGREVTFSVIAKNIESGAWSFGGWGATVNALRSTSTQVPLGDGWYLYHSTFIHPAETATFGLNSITGMWQFYAAMVTLGNKPLVDWSPSTEDTQGQIANAQNAADNAIEDITTQGTRIDSWASDSVVSPPEKMSLKDQHNAAIQEKISIDADAAKYGLTATTAYTQYVSGASAAFATWNKYTQSIPENITIGADYSNIAAYYKFKSGILTAISDKVSKDYSDSIQIGGVNLILKSIVSTESPAGYAGFIGWWTLRQLLVPGKIYVFSTNIKSAEISTIAVAPVLGSGTGQQVIVPNVPFVANAAHKAIYMTGSNANNIGYVVQLEDGNKVTPWSRCQDDLKAEIDEANRSAEKLRPFTGEFKPQTYYYNNPKRQDQVRYGNMWYLYKGVEGVVNGWVSSNWQSYGSNAESVATELLLAEEANIANFHFRNEKMVSQASTQGIPNLTLDGINGYIRALNGEVGIFKVSSDAITVDGAGGNKILLLPDNITSVQYALSYGESTNVPPTLQIRSVEARLSTIDRVVQDSASSPVFTASKGMTMTFNLSGFLGMSDTGREYGSIQVFLSDANGVIAIYSFLDIGTSTQFDEIKTFTFANAGSYKLVVKARAEIKITVPGPGGYSVTALINPITINFESSNKKNMIATNGMAVVQSSNQYAVITGNIYEVRNNNGGLRVDASGTYQYKSGNWVLLI